MAGSSARARPGRMRLPILLSPLLLAACVTPDGAYTFPEGPARIGQTVSVNGPTVRPIAVTEDSRCPVDVVCVWAGQVVLRTEVGTGRGKRVIDITLGKPVRVADGELVLRQVLPVRRHGQEIGAGDYRFIFEFAGGL